jgi:carbonic anhydrase
MANKTFAAAINCMDGRVIEPVTHWLREQLKVDYVDMITEAGPDRILMEGDRQQLEHIKERVLVSVEKHGAQTVAVVAHYDCAGYPVSREEHFQAVKQGMRLVRRWAPNTQVIGLWVNDQWNAERIEDAG